MRSRAEIAQYIRELRAVRTTHLTPREKNRVIRGYARRFAELVLV